MRQRVLDFINFSGKKETFKAGAIKLMLAGIIVRLMGFANRIFMSNLIGAEGMGLFQLTSPVYSLIILTLTSGVSISVSGMAAAEAARGSSANARRIAKTAFLLLLGVGMAAGLALVVFARGISVAVLHDERTYLSMVLLAPCIPIVASASAIKGYFYGISNVTPNAVSQIVEQIVRIGVIFLLAEHIAGQNLAYACALATVSAAVGEMANLCVVGFVFLRLDRKERNSCATVSRLAAAKEISKASWPVSLSRFLTSLMGMVEAIILPMRFVAGGYSYKASIEILGNLSGMAMPLLAFPSVITSAMATTLVPAISEARARSRFALANDRIYRCVKISFFMGFSCFGLFYSFGERIGSLFYPGSDAGFYLVALAPCCVLMYFQQTMSGILNGLEKQGCSLLVTTLSYGLRIGFLWFLLPVMGIQGYIIGMLAGMVISAVITLYTVSKETGMRIRPFDWIVIPAIPGLILMILGKLF